MLKKTRSAGLNFEIVFDKEKETWIQKVKRWCAKIAPPFNLIFLHLFSLVEESKVDNEAIGIWQQQDAPETPVIVESKSEVDGLTDLSISNPVVNSRPLPDLWGDDWNDSLANMRLWLDEDEDHM